MGVMTATSDWTALVASSRPPRPASSMITSSLACPRSVGDCNARPAPFCMRMDAAPPAWAGSHSRPVREIAEELADLCPHIFAMHDHVDQPVLFKKLGGLESFWQILMRCFLDHA